MQILRKTKKILRGILEKTDNAIQLRLGYAHWLHIGDVLAPCRGKMTGGQFIVASRILDIERIRSGTNPYWQNHLCEAIYGEKMTEAHKAKSNDGFMRLVESIDARGLNPAFAQCSIANHPLVLNNGTHRVAYLAATGKNGYLPFVCTQRDSKPWFPLDGREYFSKRGLDGKELDLLEEYYLYDVLKNVRTWLTALIRREYIEKFEQELAGFGEIVACSQNMDFDGGGGGRYSILNSTPRNCLQAA